MSECRTIRVGAKDVEQVTKHGDDLHQFPVNHSSFIVHLCGNNLALPSISAMPVRVSVFFHTYNCATGHQLISKSFVVPAVVVSEQRPSCLPKYRFHSGTEGDLYIKKIVIGDGMEGRK